MSHNIEIHVCFLDFKTREICIVQHGHHLAGAHPFSPERIWITSYGQHHLGSGCLGLQGPKHD